MHAFSRCAESIIYILFGGAIIAPSAFLLLFTYGMCLTDPNKPDYYEAKFRMMLPAWPCAVILLVGIGIAVVGGVRPFLRKPTSAGIADNWRETAETARSRFHDGSRPALGEEGITPADGDSATGIVPNGIESEASKVHRREGER